MRLWLIGRSSKLPKLLGYYLCNREPIDFRDSRFTATSISWLELIGPCSSVHPWHNLSRLHIEVSWGSCDGRPIKIEQSCAAVRVKSTIVPDFKLYTTKTWVLVYTGVDSQFLFWVRISGLFKPFSNHWYWCKSTHFLPHIHFLATLKEAYFLSIVRQVNCPLL